MIGPCSKPRQHWPFDALRWWGSRACDGAIMLNNPIRHLLGLHLYRSQPLAARSVSDFLLNQLALADNDG